MTPIGNPWDAMRQAVREAREIQSAVETSSNSMAALLRGNLRHCDPDYLQALKRELRDFNIHTGSWKEKAK